MPQLAKPLDVRYGRLDPVEWIVIRFHPSDWKLAMLECFHKHVTGQISYREAESLQRRITEAMLSL